MLRPRAMVVTVLSSGALALILSLTDPLDVQWPVRFGLLALALLWITMTLLCGLALCRPLLYRLPDAAFPWMALAFLVIATALVVHGGWRLTGGNTSPDEHYSLFMTRAVATAAIVGMLALLIYQNYLQGRQAAIRQKEAELAVLRARVQPHFLFNALNTGIALLHDRPERAERLLLDLSDLFRAALGGPASGPLHAEIALARQYLAIESLRFAERLEVHWNLPDDSDPLLETRMPALSLQPLVENAIKHGIEPSTTGGRIELTVDTAGAQVRVRVRNTLPVTRAQASTGHGIGIGAVHARIEAFGDRSGTLTTGITTTGDFLATLLLPR
nr:histidine kinase [Luteimonas sp. XNQY3]